MSFLLEGRPSVALWLPVIGQSRPHLEGAPCFLSKLHSPKAFPVPHSNGSHSVLELLGGRFTWEAPSGPHEVVLKGGGCHPHQHGSPSQQKQQQEPYLCQACV